MPGMTGRATHRGGWRLAAVEFLKDANLLREKLDLLSVIPIRPSGNRKQEHLQWRGQHHATIPFDFAAASAQIMAFMGLASSESTSTSGSADKRNTTRRSTPVRKYEQQVGESHATVAVNILGAAGARTPCRQQQDQICEADDTVSVDVGR